MPIGSPGWTFIWPWRDRRGRFVPIKAGFLLLGVLPGAWLAACWAADALGPEKVNAALHETGLWAIRFALAALAVTPLRAAWDWPRLPLVRRMLGVTALAYALAHLLLYAADQHFALAHIAREIVLRLYLTIGFVALLGLAALGATSTDAAIRRMGTWWKRLHRLAYPIGALAVLHFFLQSKAGFSQPVLMAGLLVWLLAWRALPEAWRARPGALFGLALLAGLASVAIEFAWVAGATRLPAARVLQANWSFAAGLRPAHLVGLAGLVVALVAMVRRRMRRGGAISRAVPRTASRQVPITFI